MIIQFTVPDDLWDRATKYIPSEKTRSTFGLIAFEEWVTRKEGRDRRAQREKLLSDAERLQELIDSGLIRIGGNGES